MQKNAVIVGMPRSGTSLAASIFGRKGYYAGPDCRPGDHFNPGGYWESDALVDLNANILRRTGFAHDNTWMYEPLSRAHEARLRTVTVGDAANALLDEFNAHSPWFWKDPRLCYTLRAWWPLLRDFNVMVLLVERDPDSICNSFERVGWCEPTLEGRQQTLDRIAGHLDFAKETLEQLQIPYVRLQYADISEQPVAASARLTDAFGVEFEPVDLGYDPRFNHNTPLGRAAKWIDRLATAMPPTLRRALKRVVPVALLKALYPERFAQ